jgi:hypothetical protein
MMSFGRLACWLPAQLLYNWHRCYAFVAAPHLSAPALGKSWSKTGNLVPARGPARGYGVAGMTGATDEVSGALAGIIAGRFGILRHGEKKLARAAGVTPRAARNWIEGRCCPQSAQLLRLMAECRELRAEILGIVDELERECRGR